MEKDLRVESLKRKRDKEIWREAEREREREGGEV